MHSLGEAWGRWREVEGGGTAEYLLREWHTHTPLRVGRWAFFLPGVEIKEGGVILAPPL